MMTSQHGNTFPTVESYRSPSWVILSSGVLFGASPKGWTNSRLSVFSDSMGRHYDIILAVPRRSIGQTNSFHNCPSKTLIRFISKWVVDLCIYFVNFLDELTFGHPQRISCYSCALIGSFSIDTLIIRLWVSQDSLFLMDTFYGSTEQTKGINSPSFKANELIFDLYEGSIPQSTWPIRQNTWVPSRFQLIEILQASELYSFILYLKRKGIFTSSNHEIGLCFYIMYVPMPHDICRNLIWSKLFGSDAQMSKFVDIFICEQAALWTPLSVGCVRSSLRYTRFLSSCHHEIFRSNCHCQKWCPCKRSRWEVRV